MSPPTRSNKLSCAKGPDTVGAICLEPVTAGGGVITPPKGYWERVQEICRRYDILIHIDEVVCGVGRTGEWFGYQHYGIKPDFVTMAKGVASGYAAISCTVTTEAIFDLFKDDAPIRSLFPRYFDLRRLCGRPGGSAGKHAYHRR
jgi:taurine-pyruvate aminotransferase